MKQKKKYSPAKATIIVSSHDDIICTSSGFNGPGDPIWPTFMPMFPEDPDAEWV